MKRIAVVLMLAAVSWAAQADKNTQAKPATIYAQKLFVLKYADPGQVANLLRALGALNINEGPQMRAIGVTAEKSAMVAIEDAIKQLDTPAAAPKNIVLTVNLLVGSDAESGLGSAVPNDLESVVGQLKSAFPFKYYRQVDLIDLRTRTGERASTSSDGATVTDARSGTVRTNFGIRAAGLAPDGSTVRLDNMEASIRWPNMDHNLNLNASVDVKEGQKVVVGRIGVAHDQALFVVLTAHVVQ